MSVILVRFANYASPKAQQVIEMVGDVVDLCPMPEGWRIAHRYAALPREQRLGLLYWKRWWWAWKEWESSPTDWLVVADGDVFPTDSTALFQMHDFLCGVPGPSVVARAPLNIAWQREMKRYPLLSYDFGKSLFFPGSMLAIPQTTHSFVSFGLVAIHKNLVVPILRAMLNFYASSAIVYDENTFCCVSPAGYPIVYLPPELAREWAIEEDCAHPKSAFVCPVGDVTHTHFVNSVSRLWREGL